MASQDAKYWEDLPQIDADENGPIPKVNVSVKVTALYSQIKRRPGSNRSLRLKSACGVVFRKAVHHSVFINLDMEQYAHKDFLLRAFEDLC